MELARAGVVDPLFGVLLEQRVLSKAAGAVGACEEAGGRGAGSAELRGLHAVLLIAVVASGWMYALAFAAVLARAFHYVARPTRELNLPQIGWTEVAYSVVFASIVPVALRW